MPDRILTGNSDGILGSHHRDLIEQGIFDGSLDLFDLLDGLIVVESVEKEVDIRSRAEFLVVIFAKLALGGVELFGDGEKAVDN